MAGRGPAAGAGGRKKGLVDGVLRLNVSAQAARVPEIDARLLVVLYTLSRADGMGSGTHGRPVTSWPLKRTTREGARERALFVLGPWLQEARSRNGETSA